MFLLAMKAPKSAVRPSNNAKGIQKTPNIEPELSYANLNLRICHPLGNTSNIKPLGQYLGMGSGLWFHRARTTA